MIPIQDIKQFVKAPFCHWILIPEVVIDILISKRDKPDKDATTKLDVYKQFYN